MNQNETEKKCRRASKLAADALVASYLAEEIPVDHANNTLIYTCAVAL